MEKQCEHIGFIIEYEDYYKCTKCNTIAHKYILKGLTGTWTNGNQPEEVTKQYLFEKALQMQKENELKKEI